MNSARTKFCPMAGLERLFGGSVIPHGAIAFDWLPQKGAPEIIELSISVTKISVNQSDSNVYSFSIELPENSLSVHGKGASETVGLMPKTSSFYDETRSAFFERDLADLLVAFIYELLEAGERCIILQGPLFPKLTGRLGYRYLREDITVGAVTFHPLHFTQSSVSLIPERIGKSSFKLGNGASLRISENKSNNGLIEVCKTWTLFKSYSDKDKKEIYYALDIFCQFPCGDDQILGWEQKIRKIENTFSSPGLVILEGNETWLPFGLALAWEECRRERVSPEYLLKLRGFLPFFEKDVPEMYVSKKYNSTEIVYLRTLLGMREYDTKLNERVEKKIAESVPPRKKTEILSAFRRGSYSEIVEVWKNECGGLSCWRKLLEV